MYFNTSEGYALAFWPPLFTVWFVNVWIIEELIDIRITNMVV
jgi:hypothetical protein